MLISPILGCSSFILFLGLCISYSNFQLWPPLIGLYLISLAHYYFSVITQNELIKYMWQILIARIKSALSTALIPFWWFYHLKGIQLIYFTLLYFFFFCLFYLVLQTCPAIKFFHWTHHLVFTFSRLLFPSILISNFFSSLEIWQWLQEKFVRLRKSYQRHCGQGYNVILSRIDTRGENWRFVLDFVEPYEIILGFRYLPYLLLPFSLMLHYFFALTGIYSMQVKC